MLAAELVAEAAEAEAEAAEASEAAAIGTSLEKSAAVQRDP